MVQTVPPGAMREMHWHPNADEWQYYIKGKARMGVFNTGPHVLTMDFNPGDIGYVPRNYGHYVQEHRRHRHAILRRVPDIEFSGNIPVRLA